MLLLHVDIAQGKVAYALGLDPKAFHNFGSKDEKVAGDDDDDALLNANVADDEEKFKTSLPLHIGCPHCSAVYQFPGVFHKFDGSSAVIKPAEGEAAASADGEPRVKEEGKEDVDMTATAAAAGGVDLKREGVQGIGSGSLRPVMSGLKCPNSLTSGCPGVLASSADVPVVLTQLSNRINCEIRRQTQRYYSGFYKCNDSSCGRRSRDLSVKDNRCQAQGCKGRMEREVSSKQCQPRALVRCARTPSFFARFEMHSLTSSLIFLLLSLPSFCFCFCLCSIPPLSSTCSCSTSARCSTSSEPSRACTQRIREVSQPTASERGATGAR